MVGEPWFFQLEDRLAGLSKTGDPLERLARVIDFEIFGEELDRALGRSERAKGGRPRSDAVLMFKILVLQALYGMSDEQAEYQIQDRLRFMRFLGLGLGDKVPDYSTIWRFREALMAAGAIEALFARFGAELKDRGYFALGGLVIDASIVEAPKQRLSDLEKARIKAGATGHEIWPDRPAKAAHKDTAVRWTVSHAAARRRAAARPARSGRLRQPYLGRHRLPLEGQRGGDPLGRAPVDGALEEAGGGSPCRRPTDSPTGHDLRSGRPSKTCSPSKRPAWGCSYELSASPAPPSRLGSPTWSPATRRGPEERQHHHDDPVIPASGSADQTSCRSTFDVGF